MDATRPRAQLDSLVIPEHVRAFWRRVLFEGGDAEGDAPGGSVSEGDEREAPREASPR